MGRRSGRNFVQNEYIKQFKQGLKLMINIDFGRQVEDIDLDRLMDSISQLQEIDAGIIQAVAKELSDAQISYKYAYKDYQSGGWGTFMLYNPSGNSDHDVISDGKAIPTEVISRLPLTAKLLGSLGLDYFSVRSRKNSTQLIPLGTLRLC